MAIPPRSTVGSGGRTSDRSGARCGDYSESGDAWGHLPTTGRSKATGGEDGIAGFSDDISSCWSLGSGMSTDPISRSGTSVVPRGQPRRRCKEYTSSRRAPSHADQRSSTSIRSASILWAASTRIATGRRAESSFLNCISMSACRYRVEIAKASPEDLIFRITAPQSGSERARFTSSPPWYKTSGHGHPRRGSDP